VASKLVTEVLAATQLTEARSAGMMRSDTIHATSNAGAVLFRHETVKREQSCAALGAPKSPHGYGKARSCIETQEGHISAWQCIRCPLRAPLVDHFHNWSLCRALTPSLRSRGLEANPNDHVCARNTCCFTMSITMLDAHRSVPWAFSLKLGIAGALAVEAVP
jgi:hypothetical protein